MALLGVANAVFHPADYSILGAVIEPSRLGKAFSIHTFAGFLGSAIAPIVMLLAARGRAAFNAAIVAAGVLGLVVAVPLAFAGWLDRASAARMPAGQPAHPAAAVADPDRHQPGRVLHAAESE